MYTLTCLGVYIQHNWGIDVSHLPKVSSSLSITTPHPTLQVLYRSTSCSPELASAHILRLSRQDWLMDLGVGYERKGRVRMTLGFWPEQLQGQRIHPLRKGWSRSGLGAWGLERELSPSLHVCLGKGTDWDQPGVGSSIHKDDKSRNPGCGIHLPGIHKITVMVGGAWLRNAQVKTPRDV